MAKVVMYCTGSCPYCMMAERLLAQKGYADFEKIRVDIDPSLRDTMIQKTGRRTVPQIYIDDYHVGGFDELSALEKTGQLDTLLQTLPASSLTK